MLRRVGFHEEYDGELIDRLIQLMNSDDLGYSVALEEMGWYAASSYAAAVLEGQALHYRRPDTGDHPRYKRGNTTRDAWFGLIADRLAELIMGPLGMSEEFLVRSLRDNTRWYLPHFGDTAKWDDRVALILSDQVIDHWRGSLTQHPGALAR
jgi:hypothetical protein